jgi:ketosteroid isomerase-like protein
MRNMKMANAKTIAGLAVIALAFSGPTLAASKEPRAIGNVATINSDAAVLATVQAFSDARVRFDAAKLGQLITSDYVEVSPRGELDRRAAVLAFYAADKASAVPAMVFSTQDVRRYGDTAIVLGTIEYTVSATNGATVKRSVRVTYVERLVGGRWLMASTQFTGIPAGPAPAPAAQSAMLPSAGVPANNSEASALRTYLLNTYPSLAYVERYRKAYPKEAQGSNILWSNAPLPPASTAKDLVSALVGLADYHVSLKGPAAGKSETLGVLFRTSSDNQMVVWRVFDTIGNTVKPGDVVLSIDGVPTAAWLYRVQAVTFGGNRRSRAAQGAFNLGMATRSIHEIQGIGNSVSLMVQSGNEAPRKVTLRYQPMSEDRAIAMVTAVDQRDLPRIFSAAGTRIGTMRLGVFAPQYDAAFNAANDLAEKVSGTTEEQAMVTGFCAVVRKFNSEFDAVADQADIMVLDLRGNMGGFGRIARLLVEGMTTVSTPTYDVFPSGKSGVLKLVALPNDPSCGHVKSRKPIIAMTDAGTRSAGEHTAAWMWGGKATIVGERTIGAGGGLEAGSKGFVLPNSQFSVSSSESFAFFDPRGELKAGEASEARLLDQVATDCFAPSRARPFATQAVGMRPDVESKSTLADLRDGGKAQIVRAVLVLRERGTLK